MPGQAIASSPFKRWLLLFLLSYSIFHIGYSILRYNPVTHPPVSGDFRVYFNDAREWRQDWQATQKLTLGGLGGQRVHHSPLSSLIVLPFTGFPFNSVAYGLYLLQFILFPLAFLYMVRSAFERPSRVAILVALILTLNFQPFLETLSQHKVDSLVFFLTCLSVTLFRKKKDHWAGILIGLATALKYLPGVLIGYFLLKGKWKVVAAAAVVFLLLFGLFLAVFGVETTWSYAILDPLQMLFGGLFGSPHDLNRLEANPERQTLGGTVYRWFATSAPGKTFQFHLETGISPIAHPALARGIATFLKLLLTGFYVAWIWRSRRRAGQREGSWPFTLLEISLSLIMIVVVTHGARVHYAVLLLPSFVMVGMLLVERWGLFHLREKLLFALGYALSARAIPGGLLNLLPPHPLWGREYSNLYLWLSFPFYGYMILGLCILLCYHRLLKLKE